MKGFRRAFVIVGVAVSMAVLSTTAAGQSTPSTDQGLRPYDSYQGGDLDSVSLSSGNLNLHIPLLSYPQRGGLNLSFFMRYNNKGWQAKEYDTTYNYWDWEWDKKGDGVRIVSSTEYVLQNTTLQEYDPESGMKYAVHLYDVIDPSGASHRVSGVPGNGFTGESVDASGFQTYFATDNGTTLQYIVDRNGVRYSTGGAEDPNGNKITIGSSEWTDSVGRQFPIEQVTSTMPTSYLVGVSTTDTSGCPAGEAARIWQVPAPQGGTASYKLCYGTYNLQTHFGVSGVTEGSATTSFLERVILPDQTYWQFSYNSYGDLTLLRLPTGGSISYQWENGPGGCDPSGYSASRWVSSRTVDSGDGSPAKTWTYQYGTSYGTVVTDPDGNDTTHKFIYVGCTPFESDTAYYDGSYDSGKAALRTVHTDYNLSASSLADTAAYIDSSVDYTNVSLGDNVVPIRVTTTLDDGKKTIVEKQYAPSVNGLLYGNVVMDTEYGFAGAPLQKTATTYRAFDADGSAYEGANLLDLVSSKTVCDGSVNPCTPDTTTGKRSSVRYYYDQGSLQASGISTQRDTAPAGPRGNLTTVSRWLDRPVEKELTTVTSYYDTGMPYQVLDPKQFKTTYSYDVAGSLVNTTQYPDTNSPNFAAHSVTAVHDPNTGLISSYTDQNGKTSSYSYDIMWRMWTASFPDGGAMRFYYPDPLTAERQEKKDPDGQTWTDTQVRFDGLGREVRRITANGQSPAYNQVDTGYDDVGHVAWKSYPCQKDSLSDGPCPDGDASHFDALGRPKSIVHSPDNSTVLYDYAGTATKVTDESGVSRISQNDDLGRLAYVCEVTSDPLDFGADRTPSDCGLDIPGQGFLTTYSYDLLGNLTKVHQNGLNDRIFDYDSTSRLLAASNPESGETDYSYDDDGNVITRTRPAPNQSDPSVKLTTTYTYDELQRLRTTTYSDSTPPTTINYDESSAFGVNIADAVGRPSSEFTGTSSSTKQTASIFSYDDMGRIKANSQCTPQNCGSGLFSVSYGYDDLGDITSSTNGAGVTLTYGYNLASAITSLTSSLVDSTHPATLLSGVVYGPFGLTSASLGNGVAERRGYESRGRLQWSKAGPLSVVTAGTSASGSVSLSGTEQSWQVQTQTAAAGTGSVTIDGSEQGMQTECLTPTQCKYIYDKGTVTVYVNGYSKTANYGQFSTPSSLASAIASAFQNDSISPVNATSYNGTITFTARAQGASTNYALAGTSVSTSFAGFGEASFWVSESGSTLTGGQDNAWTTYYDSGTTSITVSDHNDQVNWGQGDTSDSIATRLQDAINGDSAAAVTATASGGVVYLTSKQPGVAGNAYSLTTSSSSQRGSFTSTTSGGMLTGGTDTNYDLTNPIYSYTLNYYPNSNVSYSQDKVNGTWNYQYDDFNRLSTAVSSDTGQGCAWKYDRYGSRWQQNTYQGSCSTSQLTFSGANNRADGYTYDAAGNVLNIGNQSYTYDAENRIVCVGPAASCDARYVYDAEGRRVQKNSGATVVNYVYDLAGHVVAEINAAGGWNRGEVYAGGQHLATYADSTTYFNHSDWLGTERGRSSMANPSGLCESNTSEPYGDSMTMNGSCDPTPRFFTGKERDTESGLDYFGARYYSSALGRFMTPDWAAKAIAVPYANFGNPQSLNLYVYVGNNPVTGVDADGHKTPEGTPRTNKQELCLGSVSTCVAQKQGFWSRLGQRFNNWFSGQGFKTNMELPASVTTEQGPVVVRPDPEPNPYVALGADAAGVASAVSRNVPLGRLSAAVSVVNDPSPKNLIVTGLGLVDGLDAPIAFGTAAWDGSNFAAGVITDVFTPNTPQKIDDGAGHLIDNPALTDLGDCQTYLACQ